MLEIEVTDSPEKADEAIVLAGLRTYNLAAGRVATRPIAAWIRGDKGEVLGGLFGKTGADWLFVEIFWLPETMRGRGVGAALLRRAEEEAIARGCTGSWLDTFSFQAPGFYERQGYSVFGELDAHPEGGRRYFMQKRFEQVAE